MNTFWKVLVAGIVIIAAAAALYFLGIFSGSSGTSGTTGAAGSDTVTLALGKTGKADGVSITPMEVVNDSRCPTDVLCIQAGTITVRAEVASTTANFVIGESMQIDGESVTLIAVSPDRVSTKNIANSQYRFTFKAVLQKTTYVNASSDLLKVDTPFPGAVTGKQFEVTGKARGNWFFEGSFPVKVLDKDGQTLVAVPAQAQGEWMTTQFVPFAVSITIPSSYTGPAMLVLSKDNPSGLPQNAASISFPITIEY